MGAPKLIVDQFKAPRSAYRATKNTIVLCHGLMGFDTIDLPTGNKFSYFRGVKQALEKHGARVVACSVPPMATIELRAQSLHKSLLKLGATHDSTPAINIIAHSMGGLDARLLISALHKPTDKPHIASLTTLSTPHRGSPVANLFRGITQFFPPRYGAFSELTTTYTTNVFNKRATDSPDVRYFSYGARFTPTILSPFYLTGKYIQEKEGDNDGMVSVKSAMWGEYLGTLEDVDHADIINMSTFKPRKYLNVNYSSPAMYLQIMDDLAKQGF